ncbi:hypothetical protein GBAR_LOCUS12108 [Geodia barretti]|uniref:Uncharacterized protein n=1 Tax=Geodia barretti TaxID=519541 RepID=A0AA35RZS4_GEOBA|nr:hypothetical protein GBAR_LOCUS12108 [Geodia barretti]
MQTHPGPKPTVAVTLAKLKHCPPLENEVSPLTKAVHVTAALVLRKLCRMAPSTHWYTTPLPCFVYSSFSTFILTPTCSIYMYNPSLTSLPSFPLFPLSQQSDKET